MAFIVWGEFEGKWVWSPQPTKYLSCEDILVSNNFISNIKTFEKLILIQRFICKNGFYSKNFEEIKKL